jgi:serine phosphatase RsbU (regulator of sigma subunit)
VTTPGYRLSPVRSDAKANVTRIVDTAAELLRRNPDVSIGEIAQRADVGRSTLYRHFETREVLIEAVRRRARDQADADHAPSLRPAGELANTSVTPLSVPDVLNKVAPFQLSEQIVAEAQRLDGVESAALYVADLAGLLLRKLAGAPAFPREIAVSGSIGTEIPREAHPGIRRAITSELPGAVVAPLNLRGRAIGMLVVVGAENDALRDLAREAAVALALADEYTDALQAARRARPTSPAAEIQQNLLPTRIHRLSGATLAGNVLPGYDVGGDWFDVADNADAVWLGVADIAGTGVRAAGLAAVLLGAFRSARHQGEDPAGAMALMHEVLRGVAGPDTTATATVGCWNVTTSVFRWVTAGPRGPLLGHADGTLEVLDPKPTPGLGSAELQLPVRVCHRRLEPGQRLVLLSDGGLHSADASGAAFGTDGVRAALRSSAGGTAAATVHALERAICARTDGELADDVTTVVLAPHTH